MDVNGGEASLRWINSFLGSSFHESTAYLLIFNMFYTILLNLIIFRVYHENNNAVL